MKNAVAWLTQNPDKYSVALRVGAFRGDLGSDETATLAKTGAKARAGRAACPNVSLTKPIDCVKQRSLDDITRSQKFNERQHQFDRITSWCEMNELVELWFIPHGHSVAEQGIGN